MIGCNLGRPGPDQFRLLDQERPLEIDMIQVHDGQEAWIASAPAHVQLEIETLEFFRKHSRRQPLNPFVEVSD